MTRFLTALANEIRKGLWFAWSERLQIAMELPFFTLFILLLGPLLGAGPQIAAGHLDWTLDSRRISLLLVAFLPAAFFYFQAVKLFWRLLGEIQTGTIEQVYLSPLPSWLVAAAGRLLAAILETMVLIFATYGLVSAFVTLHFHWTAAALVPIALLVLTGVGYSLIIAGMTLLWSGTPRAGVTGLGMTLNPTPHQVETGAHRLHAWCAADALGMLPAIGRTVRVSSACPATGQTVTLTAGPDGVHDVQPPGAVVSVIITGDPRGHPRQHVQSRALRLAGRGLRLGQRAPDGALLTVPDAFHYAHSVMGLLLGGWLPAVWADRKRLDARLACWAGRFG